MCVSRWEKGGTDSRLGPRTMGDLQRAPQKAIAAQEHEAMNSATVTVQETEASCHTFTVNISQGYAYTLYRDKP